MGNSNSIKTATIEEDKATIIRIIDSIKKQQLDRKNPDDKDIKTIRDLAAKYPNNPEFVKLLRMAENSFSKAQETAAQKLFNSPNNISHSYTKEEYSDLLQKENNYFDSEKTQKRHEFINKIMSGSHINDDDKSGNSISSEQFIHFIQDISSNEEKAKAREASELFSYDLSKLKEKEASGNTLSKEENLRKEQIFERMEKHAQELLYESSFKNHQKTYAEANNKDPQETTIEEVVKASGNKIIDEVIEIYPKLKETFKGIEETLVALLFHNPEAIHKHHNNLEQLKAEADKSYQYQKEYEKERSKQLKVKEADKSSTIITAKKEEKIDKTSETKHYENIDSTRIKAKSKDSSLLAALKANKSINPKLPEPSSKYIRPDATPSHFRPPKSSSKQSGFSRD